MFIKAVLNSYYAVGTPKHEDFSRRGNNELPTI